MVAENQQMHKTMKIYYEHLSISPARFGHPLREVRYKGLIHRDITEAREQLHIVKY